MIPKACLDCGDLTTNGSRCPEHQSERDAANRDRSYARERVRYGRGTGHRARSVRLRRRQGFCLDCGTTEDLTLDHLPEAIERASARLPARDEDHEVVCRSCNSKRGEARSRHR